MTRPARDPGHDLFTGRLAGYRGMFVEGDMPGAEPALALADPVRLTELLTSHQRAANAAWRPSCSFWSQRYLASLIIPAVTIALGRHEAPGFGLGDLRVVFCPRSGVPLAFLGAAAPRSRSGPAVALASLLDDHLAPLITGLVGSGGLSARLLWENAAWPLAWTLSEVARTRPAQAAEIGSLLEGIGGPPASRTALASVRAFVLEGRLSRRRLCCLRHLVPGLDRCAGACPLATEG